MIDVQVFSCNFTQRDKVLCSPMPSSPRADDAIRRAESRRRPAAVEGGRRWWVMSGGRRVKGVKSVKLGRRRRDIC